MRWWILTVSHSSSLSRRSVSARRGGRCTFVVWIGKASWPTTLDAAAERPGAPPAPVSGAACACPAVVTGSSLADDCRLLTAASDLGRATASAATADPDLGKGIAGILTDASHRALSCAFEALHRRRRLWRLARDRAQPSYSKPIFRSTRYSTISPPETSAVDFTTSIVRMFRTVLLAVATACRAASLHERGLVPTISRMMMTPIAGLLRKGCRRRQGVAGRAQV